MSFRILRHRPMNFMQYVTASACTRVVLVRSPLCNKCLVSLPRASLHVQLFKFSGHFRAAQTLTLDSMWLPIPRRKIPLYQPIASTSSGRTSWPLYCKMTSYQNPSAAARYITSQCDVIGSLHALQFPDP